MEKILTGLKKSTWSTSRKQGANPAKAYAVEKANSNARCIKKPPNIRPWMFLCCGWHIKAFSRLVSFRRMLFRSAKAGMSQKILPSANRARSLFFSPFSKSLFSPPLFVFLKLLLASACSNRSFSWAFSGESRFTGAAFPVFESRATNMKLAVSATESESLPSAHILMMYKL